MIGISIKPEIGVGDALQFSSLPENFYRSKGEKLIDVNRHWFFDHNPFVVRDKVPKATVQMWNFPSQYNWPTPRADKDYIRHREGKIPWVYLSNAEIWASLFNVPVVLNRPRLYLHENIPYEDRKNILIHANGRSHGEMPDQVMEHILRKYSASKNIYLIGNNTRDYGIPSIRTETLWDLAKVISSARMLIGVDSGPSWIAACYPDVIVKKVRTKPNPPEQFADWVPLEINNIHSHWDDRCHQIYNVTDRDIGFTWSYKRI